MIPHECPESYSICKTINLNSRGIIKCDTIKLNVLYCIAAIKTHVTHRKITRFTVVTPTFALLFPGSSIVFYALEPIRSNFNYSYPAL